MGEAQKLDEAAGRLPVADEVEVSTETNAENPDDDEGRKLTRKLMRKLTRRLKTLSGTRKQLFRYL